jgi:hypothetical protein
MTSRLEMPRSRGTLSGTLLLLAGLWGAAIPFVGPFFDWVIGTNDAFDMTAGRFWLSLVPGLAVIAGALILTGSGNRLSGAFGAWLALAGGAWFAVGSTVSRLWDASWAGQPLGGPHKQALLELTYYVGLGALIVALAAFALGRMTIRGHRDLERLESRDDDGDGIDDDAERAHTGRFTRTPEREETAEPVAVSARDRPIL